MRARLIFSILLSPFLFAASAAMAADDAAREAARAVIMRQLDAFGRDDAGTAYAQAASGIRQLFPTPEVFLGMVRTNYRAIYRHRSFVFGATQESGETTLSQSAAIQDADGVDWIAEYSLERQTDGQWRIAGCRLSKAPGFNL